jgi:hypothetical protein
MGKIGSLIIYGLVIIAVGFIVVTQYKQYLIKQIFAKGLLEDTPLNRTAMANQNILQVLETLRTIKAPTVSAAGFESYEDTLL